MFWQLVRTAVLSLGVLLSAGGGASAAQTPAGPVRRGVSYTIQVDGAPRAGDGLAAAVGGPTQSYRAAAIFAASRGRLDIIDGGVESLFAKGDYVLFDSTDLVIVHPATREFVPLPADAASKRMDQLQAMGIKLTIGDVKVAIDSSAIADSVAGQPTRHFTMTTSFTIAIEAGGMQQHLATQTVTDYWVASVPGLPGNPLLRANGFAGGPVATGMFKALSARVDSAASLMGSRVALKTSTLSRLVQGPGSVIEMQQTSAVSDLRPRDVDESLLILPAGYRQGVLPGLDSLADRHRDAGAKWRAMPRARQ